MNLVICFLLVTSLTLIRGDADVCQQKREYEKCLDDVEHLAGDTVTPVKFWDDENLDDGCKKLSEAKACADKFENCPDLKDDFETKGWETTEKILDHICGKGKSAFGKTKDCFKSSAVGTAENDCQKQDQSAKRGNDKEKCEAANNAIKCNVAALEKDKDKCKQESVTYMKFFQLHRHRADFKNAKCTLEYDDGDLDDDGTKDGGSKMAATLLPLVLLVPTVLLQF